jgi:hypothetical protein
MDGLEEPQLKPLKRYMNCTRIQLINRWGIAIMLETLPVEFREAYATLFARTPDDVMKHVIISELKRRLAEYRILDKKMRNQYGMSFSEFKKLKIVEKNNHSFRIEEDCCDWELAIDGIQSVTAELKKLEKYL